MRDSDERVGQLLNERGHIQMLAVDHVMTTGGCITDPIRDVAVAAEAAGFKSVVGSIQQLSTLQSSSLAFIAQAVWTPRIWDRSAVVRTKAVNHLVESGAVGVAVQFDPRSGVERQLELCCSILSDADHLGIVTVFMLAGSETLTANELVQSLRAVGSLK